jgi:hypothetical protein
VQPRQPKEFIGSPYSYFGKCSGVLLEKEVDRFVVDVNLSEEAVVSIRKFSP